MGVADDLRAILREAHAQSGKGVLAFEHSLGLPGSSLKAILDEEQNQTPRLDKAEKIAHALGLELLLTPKINGPVSLGKQSPESDLLSGEQFQELVRMLIKHFRAKAKHEGRDAGAFELMERTMALLKEVNPDRN